MRQIKMSEFRSTKEISEYLNEWAANSQGAIFFDEYDMDQFYANLFIENYANENIQLFEYEYLLPASIYEFRCVKEDQEESKYALLHRFKGRGWNIEAVRESVLLFIQQSFSELEIHSGNVLIDARSKSAIFTGSFTVSKLFNFINSSTLFDIIEKIYVFPYHHTCDLEDAPFNRQKYLKIIIEKKVKNVLREKDSERFDGIISKINTTFGVMSHDKT